MKRNNFILCLMCVLWTVLCIYLSWQPGPDTAETSLFLAKICLRLLSAVGIRPDTERFHAGLRLAAHFGIFFVEGVLVTLPVRRVLKGGRLFLVGASVSSALSLLVEMAKPLFHGRHLTWSEAWLNVLGALCGVLAAWLLLALYERRKKRKNAKASAEK